MGDAIDPTQLHEGMEVSSGDSDLLGRIERLDADAITVNGKRYQLTSIERIEGDRVHLMPLMDARAPAERLGTEAGLPGAFQEGTIRVPVRGEAAVARKETVVIGEVVVDKTRTTETQQLSGTVRREVVDVDEDYERDRAAYQQAYAGRQLTAGDLAYGEAEPHYRLGYGAGLEARRAGRTWEQSEADLRARYRAAGADDDAWERLKREVRAGFDHARGR